VLPPGKTAQAILSSQFATDLAPGSPVLAADRQCVSNQMADAQSPLGATKLITACGYQPFDFLAPDTFLGLIFGALFPDGYDGIIPTTSAGAAGSGFESFANATPGLNRFVSLACSPLNHTELETNREVISQVASQLKGAPPPYTLTLNVDPPGAGSIIADPGPPYVRGLNSVVMVTAFANSGFIFNGWTGDILSQGGSSASVSMTTNRSVTAHFLPTYTLTINTTGGSGSGTVTASPAGYPPGLIYTNGTKVTLTAHPGVDSSFGAWGGAAAGTETTYKLTINGNETVTAAFNLKPLSLAGSGGLVGDFLGTASGCGFSASLYLDSVVSITLINAGSGNPTVANVSADCDSSQGDVFSYSWQGDMAWNGSQFTGTLTRTENPSRPALQLTVTLQSNGHYTAALSVPFTFYVFNTDGSCTGPLNVFHYPLNNILLVPQ